MQKYEFHSLLLHLPEPWYEITEDLPSGSPPTLARGPNGCGALQFTIALCKGGTLPSISAETLSDMLREFEKAHNLQNRRNNVTAEKDCLILRADFSFAGDFIRIYYVSDGVNICLATYVCQEDCGDLDCELQEANMIIESLQFDGKKIINTD